MANQRLDLTVDIQNRRLVRSFDANVAVSLPNLYQGDTQDIFLRFVKPTGRTDIPFEEVDSDAWSCKLGIGQIGGTPDSGTFSLTYGLNTVTGLAYNATSNAISAGLNSLASVVSAGGVDVSGDDPWVVTFRNAATATEITGVGSALSPVSQVINTTIQEGSSYLQSIQSIRLSKDPIAYQNTWTNAATASISITELQAGSATQNEIQQIVLSSNVYGGSFALTFQDETSDMIPFNASGSDIQTALEGVSTIGSGQISVAGDSGGPWNVTFKGTLSKTDLPLLISDASGLIATKGKFGTLALNTGGIEQAIGIASSISETFEIEVTPSGGNRMTVLQTTCTILNDLIEGAPAIVTPTDTYYTKIESDTLFATRAGNLSDLSNVVSARSNLGLGTIATMNASSFLQVVTVGTISASGTVTAGSFLNGNGSWSSIPVSSISASNTPTAGKYLSGDGTWNTISGSGIGDLLSVNNLSDVANVASARSNLGLGILSTQDSITIGSISASGTATANTYLRGDGSWATVSGGGDMLSTNNLSDVANVVSARSNLGLGDLAVLNQVSVGTITASGTPSSSTYLRGDGEWSAITAGSTAISTNITYVDKSGNDGTGLVDSISNPFLTIQAAINATSFGGLVIVNPGTYSEQITLKNGVNIHCNAGVICAWTPTGNNQSLLKDNGSAVTCVISGKGKFELTRDSFTGQAVISATAASNISIDCIHLKEIGSSGGSNGIFASTATIIINGSVIDTTLYPSASSNSNITVNGNCTNQYGYNIYQDGGSITINGNVTTTKATNQCIYSANGNVTLNNSVVTATDSCIQLDGSVAGSLTLNGSELISANNKSCIDLLTSTNKIVISRNTIFRPHGTATASITKTSGTSTVKLFGSFGTMAPVTGTGITVSVLDYLEDSDL